VSGADVSVSLNGSVDVGLPQPLLAGVTEIPKIWIGGDALTIVPLAISAAITEHPKLSIGIDPLTVELAHAEPVDDHA
jgi:hypothetical protein